LGESCVDSNGYCEADDTYCDMTTKVCTKKPIADAPCAMDALGSATCDAMSVCDTMLNPPRCRSLPHVGESCTVGCADGAKCTCVDAACSMSRCLVVRQAGETCDAATFQVCEEPVSQCQSGTCVLISGLQGLFEKACKP
jgi:hypothetical protein